MQFLLNPLVIECVLVVILTLVGIVVARRLRRIALRLDAITALSDFIAGLNDYFRGDYDQAVKHLDRAVAADPRNVEARIALGDCYRERGDLAEAHKHHTHVRTTFGVDEVENLRSLALDHELRGDMAAAATCMTEVHRRQPTDLDAARMLRRLRVALGEFVAAIPVQEAVLSILASTPEAAAQLAEEERELARLYALAGDQLLSRGDARAARSYLEHAIKRAPDLVGARMNLVRASMELGEVEQARALFAEQLGEIVQLAATSSAPGLEVTSAEAARLVAARASGAGDLMLLPATAGSGSTQTPRARLPALAGATAGGTRRQGALVDPARVASLGTRDFLQAVLPRVATLRCRDCGHAALLWEELCPRCEAPGSLYSIYTNQRRAVPELFDIVREAAGGAEHHRVLLERAASGDDRAAAKLAHLGEHAVEHILNELSMLSLPERGLDVLEEMGLPVFGRVLDSYCRMQTSPASAAKIRGIGNYDDALVLLARRLGTDVLPVLYGRLDRNHSTLAALSCRIAANLGDAAGLTRYRELFDARMLLAEVKRLDTAATVRLLTSTAPGSPLVLEVFASESWKGEAALAEAIKHPGSTALVADILRRRGLSPRFVTPARALLADDGCARLLLAVFDQLQDEAWVELVPAVTDGATSQAVRAVLAERLVEKLARDPTPLLLQFGQTSLKTEAELRAAIAGCGTVVLGPLEELFRSRQSRLFSPLRPFARKSDRETRLSLAAALGECVYRGVAGARDLAVRLQGGEEDGDVRSSLERAAQRAGDSGREQERRP